VESGKIKLNDTLQLKIDKNRRENIKRHHSVTHLMHSALRKVLGDHVIQKGSLVAPDRMRFDYSHFESMTKDQIIEVENLVNKWILANRKANAKVMNIEQAKSKGAMALFGEKYGEEVRVVQMGPNSTELCGGTHVKQTGDIGLFRIISEGPLASSVRRIEAVAGKAAIAYTQNEHEQLQHLTQLLNVPSHELESRVQNIIETLSSTQKELAKYKSKEALSKASDALTKSREVNGIKIITERVENMDLKVMQDYADKLRDVLQSGIVVLGTTLAADKCHILVAITKDLTGKYHAGKIVSTLAETIGGKGGGRPDFAQAGGNKPQQLEQAFTKINELI
ncbi:MAG: DHHA1 domain-containing protein, partial [bacterium]|nr:DHHA1 domain-containing protein [bacterium]